MVTVSPYRTVPSMKPMVSVGLPSSFGGKITGCKGAPTAEATCTEQPVEALPRQFGAESKISVGMSMLGSTLYCISNLLLLWLKESRVKFPCTAVGNVRACDTYVLSSGTAGPIPVLHADQSEFCDLPLSVALSSLQKLLSSQ